MHIFKRRDSRFWWIYLGLTPEGKRIYRSLKITSKRIAQLKLADYELRQARKELKLPGAPVPISDFFHDYLKYCELHKKRSTCRSDQNRLRYFREFLKSKNLLYLHEITVKTINDFLDQILKKASKATANRYLDLVRAGLRWYSRENGIETDLRIFQIKKFPEDRTGTIQIFTDSELKKIFSFPDPQFVNLLKIMFYALLRRDEARNLTWKDVDLKKGYIRIQGKPGFSPKTKRSRTIPMHSEIAKTLRRMPQNGRYLFDKGNHTPLYTSDYISHRFIKICRELKIRGKRLHDLRHTGATKLLESGVHPRSVQEILGHATLNLTLRIYTHIVPDYQKQAISHLKT